MSYLWKYDLQIYNFNRSLIYNLQHFGLLSTVYKQILAQIYNLHNKITSPSIRCMLYIVFYALDAMHCSLVHIVFYAL